MDSLSITGRNNGSNNVRYKMLPGPEGIMNIDKGKGQPNFYNTLFDDINGTNISSHDRESESAVGNQLINAAHTYNSSLGFQIEKMSAMIRLASENMSFNLCATVFTQIRSILTHVPVLFYRPCSKKRFVTDCSSSFMVDAWKQEDNNALLEEIGAKILD